ncbi:hypothetical protein BDR06DRAFT_955302 [Suillus hirtellus]|nr:hypothetical protein BDR06DRAFT_955302 [Suillus hirtellus]
MLSDLSSVSTSALTLIAIQREGKEEGSLSLVDVLIKPVPFSVDIEVEKDERLQEHIVR